VVDRALTWVRDAVMATVGVRRVPAENLILTVNRLPVR
jgi:hypothetical protein